MRLYKIEHMYYNGFAGEKGKQSENEISYLMIRHYSMFFRLFVNSWGGILRDIAPLLRLGVIV